MSRILVAYFSATGTTARAARGIAEALGADMYEIEPAQPYTSADLDWHDRKSRSSVEMDDETCRPAISGAACDVSAYDAVFVGFPVWWYVEPRIIDTFLESHDFSGKTIVPFATSGGSGMGNSSQNLQKLAPNADVKEGKRFGSRVSGTELAKWAAAYL